MRYEHTYSDSVWHTDYKQLSDDEWFLGYEDDASRFVTGYGVFGNATAENALKVLDGPPDATASSSPPYGDTSRLAVLCQRGRS